MQPPSYGGPHQAMATRSGPCDILGLPLGGSGGPSTATDATATSAPNSFITSTVYLPLSSVTISEICRTDLRDDVFIIIFDVSIIGRH